MAFWESLIGPAIGGLLGGGDDEQTQTSTNAPWAAAQPFMLRNLQDTEKLGNYYKQNPFNKQQIESYSNLFGDNNNFRSNIAPGLMNFANSGMTGQYQRATGGRPGDGAGYGGMRQPGGRSQGLLGASTGQSSGPFSVGQGAQSGGLLDLNGAQNPFANGGITANPTTVTEEMISALKAQLDPTPGNDQDRGGGGYQGSGKDVFGSIQDMINTPFGAMTVAMAASLGLLGNMKQNPANVSVEDRQGAVNFGGGDGFGIGGGVGAGLGVGGSLGGLDSGAGMGMDGFGGLGAGSFGDW